MNRISAFAEFVVFVALAGSSRAGTLEVDASAPPGSGVYHRISDAVAAAQPGDTIHIAPGVYSNEDRPIRLGPDKAGVTLDGSTVLSRDERELATGAVQSTVALVRPNPPLQPFEAVLYVTGENVTVRGLVVDGGNANENVDHWGIFVDGNSATGGAIGHFRIAENWTHFCGTCIFTRGASGVIERNLIGKVTGGNAPHDYSGLGGHHGATIGGGSSQAEVFFQCNRVSENGAFGATFMGDRGTVPPPDATAHTPGALLAHILLNDFVGNGGVGFSLMPFENHFAFSEGDEPSSLVADVQGNTLTRNGRYGFVVHDPLGAFSPDQCAGAASGTVRATLVNNQFQDSGSNDALFTFTAIVRSVDGAPACYGHDTAYMIDDDGGIKSFDYDAPCCNPDEPHPSDPASCSAPCTPLHDVLTVNGGLVIGRSLTPHH